MPSSTGHSDAVPPDSAGVPSDASPIPQTRPFPSRPSSGLVARIRHLLEMIRFSHTLFALPFALLASVMAWATPHPQNPEAAAGVWPLLAILVCMVGARSAAMAFNRLIDRRIDAANPRTAQRHLPAGLLSPAVAAVFTGLSGCVFVAGAAMFWPNWLPLVLSGPVLAFLLGYSYAKRFTSLAHFWLGLGLALAPICAWIAIRGLILLANPTDLAPAVVLGAGVLFWVAGFDIIYACQDYEFDKQAGLFSVPARMGVRGALRLSAACHLVMLVVLAMLPLASPELSLGWLYGSGLAAAAVLLCYEHWLVRPGDLARVNLAFFYVNVVIGIWLFVVGAIDVWT